MLISLLSDCPPLKSGIGALASNRDTAFGTVVTFSCPIGQEFATGKSRLVTKCLDGGKWSITYIPSCQGKNCYGCLTCKADFFFFVTLCNLFTEVYCGPVPQIDNGFSIGSTNVTYRGVATYQCYAGFAFPTGQPIERISCLSDGRWERTPTCLGKKQKFKSIKLPNII